MSAKRITARLVAAVGKSRRDRRERMAQARTECLELAYADRARFPDIYDEETFARRLESIDFAYPQAQAMNIDPADIAWSTTAPVRFIGSSFGGIVHDPDAETITLHLAADGTFAIVDESGGTEQSH